jgi:hypothetical protein
MVTVPLPLLPARSQSGWGPIIDRIPELPFIGGQPPGLSHPTEIAVHMLRCEHSRRRHLLGAEALKEVKTPGLLLLDALFTHTLPGQDEKESHSIGNKIRVQTSMSVVRVFGTGSGLK